MTPVIAMTGITKSYRLGPVETPVLRGIDLTVLPGDFTSVMGPSGCGKSTLMNIMGLLDRPGGGSYRLLGQDVAGLEDRALSKLRNRCIGFVFQSYQLLARQDALGNVGLPLIYRGEDKPEVARRARRALELVGISDLAGRLPGELSGGQQQRVAIARALAGEPGLVLADEPTGALDSATGEEIMALFARLNREQGQTIVLITHDPKVAGGCRRRLRMSDGRLDETEPPQPFRPALGNSPGVMDAP